MRRMISGAAAVLCLTLMPGAGAAFTDIGDETTQLAAATLQGLGVVNGTTSTTFDPDRPSPGLRCAPWR